MTTAAKIQIVPKEEAVFWLDGDGRWHNAHGPFENPKISAYFHACIDRDADGFFLRQERDGIIEKVYFPVADTALFIWRVTIGDAVTLTLNTGRVLRLDPAALFIRNDSLYVADGDVRIKFSVDAVMKLAPFMEDSDAGTVFIFGGVRWPVGEG